MANMKAAVVAVKTFLKNFPVQCIAFSSSPGVIVPLKKASVDEPDSDALEVATV
jgi:hypothetical protein